MIAVNRLATVFDVLSIWLKADLCEYPMYN